MLELQIAHAAGAHRGLLQRMCALAEKQAATLALAEQRRMALERGAALDESNTQILANLRADKLQLSC